jgi:arsenate reductase
LSVLSRRKIVHQGFDDPPRLTQGMSDEEEILEVYRRVRDEIKEYIEKFEI